jgi:F-type H+-transporting ATPase subunit gamma
MAQLITMRQRIRAIETIRKITQAMRLISMSSHSRLRHKKAHLERYKKAFQQLWQRVRHAGILPLEPVITETPAHLIILAGSQKGLCGTFNSSLFKFFEHAVPVFTPEHHFIAVGKYAATYFKQRDTVLLASYATFTSAHYISIAQAITTLILEAPTPYTSVTIYSNTSKSFFVQNPSKFTLIPFKEPEESTLPQEPSDYLFEQSPQELSTVIQQLMISVTLQEFLFESLLAEQAARFISMDSSTRNADNLLISMKLGYNKTRQSIITRELTELASSY